MITIENPSIRTEDGAATISYPILQDGQAPRTLSFTVDSRFRDFLNPGRADGAIIALLPWISRQGGLVRILPAISPRLYHFGIRILSHILTGIGPFLKPVELVGEVNAEALSPIPGRRTGTGGSLGVDSLCTIAELEKAGTPVTHLFHNNCGSHWGSRELLDGRRELCRKFAAEQRKEFVWMDSSLSDFYGNDGYLNFFPFLDAGSILALNGLFSSYYYSTSCEINHPSFTKRDKTEYCAFHLESHILQGCETETTRFQMHGLDLTRAQKTAIIANYPPAYQALNVCLERVENCGRCAKCRRTISQLFLLEKLFSFSKVFNLAPFREDPVRFLALGMLQDPHFRKETESLIPISAALTQQEKRRLRLLYLRKRLFQPFQRSRH